MAGHGDSIRGVLIGRHDKGPEAAQLAPQPPSQPPSQPMPWLPPYVTVDELPGGSLEIVIRESRMWRFYVGVVLLGLLVWLQYKQDDGSALWAGIVFLGMVWVMGVFTANTRSVRVSRHGLRVSHSPFPWFGRHVPARDLEHVLRAAELMFRAQRGHVRDGALILADNELVAEMEAERQLSPLHAMFAGNVEEIDVLGDDNAWTYWSRSDAHSMALNFGGDARSRGGLATAIGAAIFVTGRDAGAKAIDSPRRIELVCLRCIGISRGNHTATFRRRD